MTSSTSPQNDSEIVVATSDSTYARRLVEERPLQRGSIAQTSSGTWRVSWYVYGELVEPVVRSDGRRRWGARRSRGGFESREIAQSWFDAYAIENREALTPREQPAGRKGSLTRKGYLRLVDREHPTSGSKGRIFAHRLVVERHLGRALSSDEVVHHVNGDRLDNRIENLRVLDRSTHAKLHWERRRAREAA